MPCAENVGACKVNARCKRNDQTRPKTVILSVNVCSPLVPYIENKHSPLTSRPRKINCTVRFSIGQILIEKYLLWVFCCGHISEVAIFFFFFSFYSTKQATADPFAAQFCSQNTKVLAPLPRKYMHVWTSILSIGHCAA